MADPGRRRPEMPGRLFRLAVRDLRAAAAAPENPRALEEPVAPPPPPRIDTSGPFHRALAVRETADAPGGMSKKRGDKMRSDSTGDEDVNGRKRRWSGSIGSEGNADKKRSRLPAEPFALFTGKPTGARESTFSSEEELVASTSAATPRSLLKNQIASEVYESWEDSIGEGYKDLVDPSEMVKNKIAAINLIAELEANFSLDSCRHSFAVANGLPPPPPSSDRSPTPPIPSSPPPPIIEISSWEEADNAIMELEDGCHMYLQVSNQLSVSDAQKTDQLIKTSKAEMLVLNLPMLKAKASQGKFLQQQISHTAGKLQEYNEMLALPWIPHSQFEM